MAEKLINWKEFENLVYLLDDFAFEDDTPPSSIFSLFFVNLQSSNFNTHFFNLGRLSQLGHR